MQPGDVVGGRFELQHRAGTGGMGEVFRAADRVTGDTVAVKVLLSRHAQELARFKLEARILAELSHPGVVQYVAHGVAASGEPYLAMEWLEGEDLLTRLLRVSLTVEESVTVAARAAEALGAVHARGVVHRDLKPTNLFLVGGDIARIKVLDFGIAKLGGISRVTRSGLFVGTPGYMAPEQARTGQSIDARADVFSLGCVFYECLTGEPTFAGEHILAVLGKILFEEAPRVRERLPGVPAVIDSLIARMLAKDPKERPRDGAAVAGALASIADRGELLPGAQPPPHSISKVALTSGERRALSLVLIGRPSQGALNAEIADTMNKTAADAMDADTQEALRRAAEPCGGRFEALADGSALVIMSGARLATDQAALSARCALALRPVTVDRPIVVVTGYGQVMGRIPVGEVIDRAARMLTQRTPMEPSPSSSSKGALGELVVIDEVTAGLLDARFDVRESQTGLRLHGERDLPDEARTLLGRPTPCVGRERELSVLEQLFRGCEEEHAAQAVLITSPAGVGKSRLAHELIRRLKQRAQQPVAIWTARGDSLRSGSPFGLLGQALRSACGIHAGEPANATREKLRAKVAERVEADAQARVAAFLGELIGAPAPDDGSPVMRAARQDAHVMGDQMRRAWQTFLAAETSARPVLLVLEDLHWGDLPTVRFIEASLRDLSEKPWMVLALARPSVHQMFPKLWGGCGVQEIYLKELSRKASERLIRQVLGDRASPDVVDRLHARAEGNAFYLEELIRSTAERRGDALPETILAMVQSRLEALDGEARRVLRAGSVFGEVFWQGGVEALIGAEPRSARVNACLDALVESELLAPRGESRLAGERELAFRHALLREGAYATLTEADRALGHRLAGAFLEQRGESDPLALAKHYEQGGEPGSASPHYLRAAEQAHWAGDVDAAIEHAQRGLANAPPRDVRVALLGLVCDAAIWRAEESTTDHQADEVMSLAPQGSTPWARAAAAKLLRAQLQDRTDEWNALLAVILAAEPSPDAMGAFVTLLALAIYLLHMLGKFASAEAYIKRLIELVDPMARRDPRVSVWPGPGASFAFADGRSAAPALELSRPDASDAAPLDPQERVTVLTAQVCLGSSAWFVGAYEEAELYLRDALSTDELFGPIGSYGPLYLIFSIADRGDLEEARRVASRTVEVAQGRGLSVDEGRGRWGLADVLLRVGEHGAAERECERALALLEPVPRDLTGVRALLAAIWLAQGRGAEAKSVTQELTRAYSAAGAHQFKGAYVRLVHAEALDASGDHERARAAIAGARDRLLASAATIPELSRRQSFLRRVPENARTLALAERWLSAL